MKIIKIKKSVILKIIILFIFVITLTKLTSSFGMQHYYNELSWPFIAVSIAGDW